MTKRTYVTHPDGRQTVIETTRSGCSSCLWILLVLFLIAAPGVYFPAWLAVICYIVEALIVLAVVRRGWNGWQDRPS
jgi:hypothetical protein